MHRWLLLTVAVAPLLLAPPKPASPDFIWWTTHALDKVRPTTSIPEDVSKSVSIAAAKNEFEPFQIVLRAQSQTIENVDVDVTELRDSGGAVIAKQNATVFFETMLNVKTPSTIEGADGEWPDALVPRIDKYSGERRNAFPFNLQDGRNQPIWIEIYVPAATPAGMYHGEVQVSVRGKPQFSVPIALKVWNFTLPSTSSLPNSYGFSAVSAVRQHYGRYTSDDDVMRLTYIYQKAALQHRISLHGGTMRAPRAVFGKNKVGIDWQEYDAEVGPFLDGRAIDRNEPLSGAKSTSIDLRLSPAAETDEAKVLFIREVAKHFREKGWFDRLFNYVWDEPNRSDAHAVLQKAQLARAADPEIRNLVTASLNPTYRAAIDIWTPLINCFENRSGHQPFCDPMVDRASYEPELQSGKRLWWYQSCASHGCNTLGGGYFSGWPSYMVDIGAVANRIMEWVTWKYGVSGELYFTMIEAYSNSGHPWEDVNRFGGNGDGTLFYPGRPDRIGGKNHIPVESIRLKLIREGLEDYEYLHLLEAAGESALARDQVNTMVHKTYDFEHDPSKLYEARRKMGEALSRKN